MPQAHDVVHARGTLHEDPEWPALVSRAVGDISRIVHAEIQLAELGVRNVIEQEIDRALKVAIALGLLLCAVTCTVGAAVLGLYVVLGRWWAAFAVVAAASGLGGILFFLWAMRRPSPSPMREVTPRPGE
jgi:hypothetical protein